MSVKSLFLLDAAGALLSAFLLGMVLVEFEAMFGIPANTLYFLASLPCLFAVYDLYCYRAAPADIAVFLKRIAFANLGYCLLSLALACHHREELTGLGWTYILLEIVVVALLASFELRTAFRVGNRKSTDRRSGAFD
ncbi:MAG: hypothetical protein KDC32_07565 [Saprospiraceae bacterium]|nr:hypothetical protein [Saprospiraceae bacterium]MCB0679109.1 hypothetical protein [Saprospiraceae bacterium]MCB0680783.1 hypothetical protein [Saprospiraceae bacterium]